MEKYRILKVYNTYSQASLAKYLEMEKLKQSGIIFEDHGSSVETSGRIITFQHIEGSLDNFRGMTAEEIYFDDRVELEDRQKVEAILREEVEEVEEHNSVEIIFNNRKNLTLSGVKYCDLKDGYWQISCSDCEVFIKEDIIDIISFTRRG